MRRKIIEIDEALCNGCGQCVNACAEGALKLIDGKARLVSEVYCDGLGACIGDCPTGALTIVEREADEFDEQAAIKHARACPGSSSVSLAESVSGSSLMHFPVKLQLLRPEMPFLQGAELLLMADCCGVCYPKLHQDLLRGRVVAIACPKFDALEQHVERLIEIIRTAGLKRIIVARMEVPCCRGLVRAAVAAVRRSGASLALEQIIISRQGVVLDSGPVNPLD